LLDFLSRGSAEYDIATADISLAASLEHHLNLHLFRRPP
jgi:hypothetical protein